MGLGVLIRFSLFTAGFACFAGFTWAVKAHFRRPGGMPFGMKIISTLTVAGFGWFAVRLVFGVSSGLWVAGMGCFALALAIFAWAIRYTRDRRPTLAFDAEEPSVLLDHGPYQYVRHPFYVSYMLFWIGTALSSPGLLPWAAPVLMQLVYLVAALREEQKFDHSGLAAAYRQYRAKVGMFLPHFGQLIPH